MSTKSEVSNIFHDRPLYGMEPGYMVPDVVVPVISVSERVDALARQIMKLSQEGNSVDFESTPERDLGSQIDELKRQIAYWTEDPNYVPSHSPKRNERFSRSDASPVAYEAWSGPTLDEALYVSRQLDPSALAGRVSMRPSDPEGPVHRKLFYAELEVDHEQVLSPRLSSGASVAIINSPEQLFFDSNSERLSISSAEDKTPAIFDAWLITDSAMAKSTPMEMAVADCPAVFLTFRKNGAIIASGGAHAGWPNMLNGVAENFSDAVDATGIVYDHVEIVVGPGAMNLTLPTRLLDEYSTSDIEGLSDFIRLNEDEVPGFEAQSTFTLDNVALASKVFRDAVKREGVVVRIEDTEIDTLDEANNLASYRREGKYASDDISMLRPAGGRFLTVFVPDVRKANSNYRNNLFTSLG